LNLHNRLASLLRRSSTLFVSHTSMTSPQPIRLTRRGELLRAVSHAIRCLSQVSPADSDAWRREAKHFEDSIRSGYSDILEHVPVEFDRLLASGDVGVPLTELLERLSHEIRRETHG